MKKVVILFIVSTMVLTGMPESARKDNEEECTGMSGSQEKEHTEETVASVKAADNRFYARYSDVINKIFAEPENENATDEPSTEVREQVTENVQSENETQPQTETQTETQSQTEMQTETQPQTETQTETQSQTETQAETQLQTELQTEPVCSIVSDTGIYISDSDYGELLKIVEAEAGNQDDVGKILVANVIFNRVRSGEFPSTVTDVIYQNGNGVYQFEPVLNGRINTVTVSDSTVECVNRAISGEDYSQGALYFTMRTSDDSWFNRCLTLLFIHGDHYFYTC